MPEDKDRLALMGIIKNEMGGFEIWAVSLL
jgi:hypothetical protein